MTTNTRLASILATSAIALALSTPAFAQTTTTETAPAAQDMQNPTTEAPASDTAAPVDPAATDKAPNKIKGAVNQTHDKTPTTSAAPPVSGLDTADRGLPSEPILTEQKSGQLVSDDVIGMDVRNPSDESIGSIDALVIDDRNRIVAGIVSVGGFLGLGAKEVAVNWKEFQFQIDEDIAIVMLSREQLENAPAFRDREELQQEARVEERRDDMMNQPRVLDQPATAPSAPPKVAE